MKIGLFDCPKTYRMYGDLGSRSKFHFIINMNFSFPQYYIVTLICYYCRSQSVSFLLEMGVGVYGTCTIDIIL